MVKSCLIFDQAYNPGVLLILWEFLKNWVAEGDASDINDFIPDDLLANKAMFAQVDSFSLTNNVIIL